MGKEYIFFVVFLFHLLFLSEESQGNIRTIVFLQRILNLTDILFDVLFSNQTDVSHQFKKKINKKFVKSYFKFLRFCDKKK